jgi:glycosyltransferase involved in cell wall biosynthesis
MKILMISAGLMPKRDGGVPLYVDHVRRELSRRGHDVTYLDTYCQDNTRRPRIVQTKNFPSEYSFFNSGSRPPWVYMPTPLSDIHASPAARNCFAAFLAALKPDIVHVHEMFCVPFELIAMSRALGYKLVLTTQDYFVLCPTIQLFKYDRHVCKLTAPELQCHKCVRHWPEARLRPATARIVRSIKGSFLDRRPFGGALRRCGGVIDKIVAPFLYRGSQYHDRRSEAVKYLRAFHLIICMSQLQSRLTSEVSGANLPVRQVYLSLPTYSFQQRAIPAATAHSAQAPVRFAALNINHTVKGRELLLAEFQSLRSVMSNVELHLFGSAEGAELPGVFYRGKYVSKDLDELLSTIDAGIIPSIWPEAYAYVGPEMLSRGIPLIVSTAGAMQEYVVPNFNGVHFDPAKPGALCSAMELLASNTQLREQMRANAPKSRQAIREFPAHVDEMEAIYAEILGQQ